jgi:hypothetical protein
MLMKTVSKILITSTALFLSRCAVVGERLPAMPPLGLPLSFCATIDNVQTLSKDDSTTVDVLIALVLLPTSAIVETVLFPFDALSTGLGAQPTEGPFGNPAGCG